MHYCAVPVLQTIIHINTTQFGVVAENRLRDIASCHVACGSEDGSGLLTGAPGVGCPRLDERLRGGGAPEPGVTTPSVKLIALPTLWVAKTFLI